MLSLLRVTRTPKLPPHHAGTVLRVFELPSCHPPSPVPALRMHAAARTHRLKDSTTGHRDSGNEFIPIQRLKLQAAGTDVLVSMSLCSCRARTYLRRSRAVQRLHSSRQTANRAPCPDSAALAPRWHICQRQMRETDTHPPFALIALSLLSSSLPSSLFSSPTVWYVFVLPFSVQSLY